MMAVGAVFFYEFSGRSDASADVGSPVVRAAQPSPSSVQPALPAAYVAAVTATQQCLEDAGLKGVTHSFDAAGKFAFSWGGFATRAEAQAAGQTYQGCYVSNLADADRLWQQSH